MEDLYEDIRPHTLEKHEMLRRYLTMFTTSMKGKYRHRVYIDLFAGCGQAHIDGNPTSYDTSPLLALSMTYPFTRYIFCERDEEKMDALRSRVRERAPDADVRFVPGDVNQRVQQILDHMPKPSPEEKVLTFAMVDPYNLGTLKFKTLESLGKRYFIDMLVLLATYMDGKRNKARYLDTGNNIIAELLGDPEWRSRYWSNQREPDFGLFLISEFMQKLNTIGYLKNDLNEVATINAKGKGVRLYNLTFFTRNELGKKFWKNAKQRQDGTISLDFPE